VSSATPQPPAFVRAAGTVPWRRADDGTIEVVLVHRGRYGDWSLPKGKLDAGEAWHAAAVRETREESGLVGELGPELCGVAYSVSAGPKLVRYWLLRVTGGEFAPNHEVDQVRWVDLAAAIDQAQYRGDRAVLRSAALRLTASTPTTRT
jgi:8-oxo-(d)GTP phosphatase